MKSHHSSSLLESPIPSSRRLRKRKKRNKKSKKKKISDESLKLSNNNYDISAVTSKISRAVNSKHTSDQKIRQFKKQLDGAGNLSKEAVLKNKKKVDKFFNNMTENFWNKKKEGVIYRNRSNEIYQERYKKSKNFVKHCVKVIQAGSSYDMACITLKDLRMGIDRELDKILGGLVLIIDCLKNCLKFKTSISALGGIVDNIIVNQFLKLYPMIFDELYLTFAELMYLHRDNEYASFLYDQVKIYAMLPIQRRALMKSYQGATKVMIRMGRYSVAMGKAKRALELAFALKDVKTELTIYDLMGKIFFYLGNMNKAKYFHERLMKNIPEPEDSPIKRMFLKRLENRNRRLKLHILKHGSASYAAILAKIQNKENEMKVFDSSSDEDEMPISKVAGHPGGGKQTNKPVEPYPREQFPNYYKVLKKHQQFSKIKRTRSCKFYVKRKKDGIFIPNRRVTSDKIFKEDEIYERNLQHMSANRDTMVHFLSKKRSDSQMSYYASIGDSKASIVPIGMDVFDITNLLTDSIKFFTLFKSKMDEYKEFLKREMNHLKFREFLLGESLVGGKLLRGIGKYLSIGLKKSIAAKSKAARLSRKSSILGSLFGSPKTNKISNPMEGKAAEDTIMEEPLKSASSKKMATMQNLLNKVGRVDKKMRRNLSKTFYAKQPGKGKGRMPSIGSNQIAEVRFSESGQTEQDGVERSRGMVSHQAASSMDASGLLAAAGGNEKEFFLRKKVNKSLLGRSRKSQVKRKKRDRRAISYFGDLLKK